MKIGIDIVQISRIESSLERFGEKFKHRFLVASEIESAHKIETMAGYWAAKEAVAKALGCGIGAQIGFHDISITKDSSGTPSFSLSTDAQKRFVVKNASLSISHDGGFAIAVVVLVMI